MRKCFAPSKLNKVNSQFITPLIKTKALQEDDTGTKPLWPEARNTFQKPFKIPKIEETQDDISTVRTTTDILKLLDCKTNISSGEAEDKNSIISGFQNFSNSSIKKSPTLPQIKNNEPELEDKVDNLPSDNNASADPETRYFSAMWCKRSNKKHKKWEGDAVLKVLNRSAILFDMDGKVIGRGSSYKTKELVELSEGSRLIVGGKECEIQGVITKAQFENGTCFISENVSTEKELSTESTRNNMSQKGFQNPLRNANQLTTQNVFSNIQPKYPITGSNVLVMPRPSKSHQWQHNKKGAPIIDVVVDPKLVKCLRPHQKEGVLFLYKCVMGMQDHLGNGAVLADEMGLGKTLQCIALIWTLLKQGPYGRQPVVKTVLVITPSSLVKNWLREFQKWLGSGMLSVYAVDQQNTINGYISSDRHSVLLISYEMFTRSAEALAKKKFDLLICDEGHRLKNSSIKTSSTIMQLSTLKRIILTGTPIQNDLQELFSIIDFCNPGILGSSSSFKQIFETPILESQRPGCSKEQLDLGSARAEKLNLLMSQFILRRTQDIIDKYIPPKIENVIFCKPTKLQTDVYSKILNSKLLSLCLQAFKNDHASTGMNHLVCITALKKLCNHPYLLKKDIDKTCNTENEYEQSNTLYAQIQSAFSQDYDLGNSRLTEDSGKFSVLFNILAELRKNGREKIVIVSNYTQTLSLVEELCQQEGYSFLRLDGSTPSSKRQDLVDSFNRTGSPYFVFLLSTKAGGVGLNLIGASRIVLFDIDWNPANDLQAQARVWRDGQKKIVHCYRLITTGTIEEKIYQRQISKQSLSTTVIDIKESGKVKFSLELLRDLFSFEENSLSTTHDSLKCECLTKDDTETEPPKETDNSNIRPYQLGVKTKPDNRNRGMSELMLWKHIPACRISELVQDDCLQAASQHITFLFQNETNNSFDCI